MRTLVDIALRITMWIARVIILLIFNVILIRSKRYDTRCKLVRDLLRVGVPNDIFLGQWVCLIEKVNSNRDTSALTTTPSGKKSYGLFQIPKTWCKEGKPGGECKVRCESLLDDDIRDDTVCANTIYLRHGFKYWEKWEKRCKNDNFITNEIYKCPDLSSRRSSPERNHGKILRYRRMLITNTFARSHRQVIQDPRLKRTSGAISKR